MRGFGVLFLMWCVPYAVAAWNPYRFQVALYESIAMQTIGLIGELVILSTLSDNYANAIRSIKRFSIFDSAGLIILFTALLLVVIFTRHKNSTPV